MTTATGRQPHQAERVITIQADQLRIGLAVLAMLAAALGLFLLTGRSSDGVETSAANPLIGAQATTSGSEAAAAIPVLQIDAPADAAAAAMPVSETAPATDAAVEQPEAAAPTTETTTVEQPAPAADPAADSAPSEQPSPAATPDPAPAPAPAPAPNPSSGSNEPALGAIKSKADDKGYDVHGHVEHSVVLLGQQVLIPGQAATGGFIQTGENEYLAYSPVTAMLPVAIQDNKEIVNKKPELEGEKLYRRLAQEYTGSNDYKKLNKDAQRAINILTCTDWSLVEKRVRENTINHLLHSPISFGTIGSVENPISTDVTIDLGYTHTRDKNWTEVEYMGNNVYKITVVSNNNNGSHTGHEMGTAYVAMPAGTSLKEAQKIGNQMIPSKNKNNKLTIDPAARALFDALPRGASPMILFEHLSEAEQNAFFEGRGIETVGKPNPDCNPLQGGILGSTPPPPDDPAPDQTTTVPPTTEPPADETTSTTAPSTDDSTTSTSEPPADDQTTSTTEPAPAPETTETSAVEPDQPSPTVPDDNPAPPSTAADSG
ncbi:MAG: hypothetical protein AAGA93_16335 [Actinomycetota bacterium]